MTRGAEVVGTGFAARDQELVLIAAPTGVDHDCAIEILFTGQTTKMKQAQRWPSFPLLPGR